MKIKKNLSLFLHSVIFILNFSAVSFAQTHDSLKRTNYKTDKFDFGVGGTVSVIGAPIGSITIEGWQKNEVEISADIANASGDRSRFGSARKGQRLCH